MSDKEIVLAKKPVRSEEVREIIEKMPSRFGNISMLFLVFIVSLALSFGFIVKYPDVVTGELKLNSTSTQVRLVSNVSGKIQLLSFKPQSMVKSGQYIGYIENPARLQDVKHVDSLLHLINLSELNFARHRNYFPSKVELGELNEQYFVFLSAIYSVLDHHQDALFSKQEETLTKLVNTQLNILNKMQRDFGYNNQAFELLSKSYQRDSILNSKKVLTVAELERSRIALITGRRSSGSVENDLATAKYELEDAVSKLQQLKIQKKDQEQNIQLTLVRSFYDLTEGIKQWKLKYAFIAPIDGILEYTDFWNNNDFLPSGQEVFSVIPANNEIHAQMLLPEKGAGKVHKGQAVIIKLNDFPYNEYGSIKGYITSISMVSSSKASGPDQRGNFYLVRVQLPKGLTTNYGTRLKFRFGAKGTADVITDDKRLIERLFDNLKYQVKK